MKAQSSQPAVFVQFRHNNNQTPADLGSEAKEESIKYAKQDLVSLSVQRKSDRSSWGIGGGPYLSSLRSLTGGD